MLFGVIDGYSAKVNDNTFNKLVPVSFCTCSVSTTVSRQKTSCLPEQNLRSSPIAKHSESVSKVSSCLKTNPSVTEYKLLFHKHKRSYILTKSLLFLFNLCTVASYDHDNYFRGLVGVVCLKHDIIVTLSDKAINARTHVCSHKRHLNEI